MYQVIIVIHVLLGLGIIGLVLMQQGKGADAGAAFGAGASGSVFGAQGAASFLSRTTAIFATLFFLTSLGLAIMNSQKGVAYDLMSDKASETETLAIPDAGFDSKASAAKKEGVESDKPEMAAPSAIDIPSDSAAPDTGAAKPDEKASAPVSEPAKVNADETDKPAEKKE